MEERRTAQPHGIVGPFPDPFNVATWFIDRHLAEGRGDKVAILSPESEVSYQALVHRVNRCAHALRDRGLRRGDRILLALKDGPAFFYVFWGAIKAGLIPVPLNTLLRASDYAYMLEDSGCAAFLYAPALKDEAEAALAESTHTPPVVLFLDDATAHDLFERGPDHVEAVPTRADDDCFWLYSSGSTGQPKGTIHRHRDLVYTSELYGVRTLGIQESDRVFSAAKLFFAYGLGNGMSFPLWVGATSILLEGRPTPEATFAMIERFRPTLYFGVPTLYAAQTHVLETFRPDLSSIRLCVSAGEALPAEIFQRWQAKTGLMILDGIGSTEALHIFISNRPDAYKPGSSGRLVEGYEARLVDDHGQDVQNGEKGHLLIRGGSTARAYWRNPERTASTMLGDWLATGDTYCQDEEGFFFYQGRSDDMLKVGGIWCSPFEIESALIAHPAVLEAAVVGRPDAHGLIKPEAWIVIGDTIRPTEVLERELKAVCQKKLAPYKFPRRFHFVDELPKTATGKVQRFRLRADER